MDKKRSRKKTITNPIVTVFFVLGLILIMVDMVDNITDEATNGQDLFYGYIDPQMGGAGADSLSNASRLPTPTIDPLLTDFNQ